MYKAIILVLFLTPLFGNTKEVEVLNVDRTVPSSIELSFPNDKGIKAKASDFSLINYVVMSNEVGERWAVVTLTNSAHGSRVLQSSHIMALFANGDRINPVDVKLSFEPKETQSVTVSFGESKFPILSIKTEKL